LVFGLTAEAALLLSALTEAEAPDADAVLRFQQDDSGFGLGFDAPRECDLVVAFNGRVLLVVDADLAARLGACALAINQTPAGPELALIDTAAAGELPAVTIAAGSAPEPNGAS